MVCIYCKAETAVVNSRAQKRSNQVWRRRKCQGCSAIFTTHEAVDLSNALMVGSKPFLTDMLFTEVLLALQDRKDCYLAARETTSTVIRELLKSKDIPKIESKQISLATAKVLKRLDKRAWMRYVSEHPSLEKSFK